MTPLGFSTWPCLSRWTMVVSDIARPAYLLVVRPGSRYARTGRRSLTWRPQCVADRRRYVAGVVPHDEGGESQHPVAVQGEVVVTVHIGPVLRRVQVMDAVHLDDKPGGLPHRVEPPAAAARIVALGLPVRLRQPVLAEQPGQVELRKRLRAARDVIERVLDHGPVW